MAFARPWTLTVEFRYGSRIEPRGHSRRTRGGRRAARHSPRRRRRDTALRLGGGGRGVSGLDGGFRRGLAGARGVGAGADRAPRVPGRRGRVRGPEPAPRETRRRDGGAGDLPRDPDRSPQTPDDPGAAFREQRILAASLWPLGREDAKISQESPPPVA